MSRRKTFDFGQKLGGGSFALPNEVSTETTAIIGRRGSGKSNSLTVMLEGLDANGYPFVLIDPKGEGWGLRRPGDSGRDGIDVVVIGEPEGDLPLPEDRGDVIAEFVVSSGRSVVLSLAGMSSDAAERRFVAAFCDRLYRMKMKPEHQTPLLVAIEEAHLFVPQSVGRDETDLVRSIQRLVRQGRSLGIGVALADQRPASVNKNVLTQLEILVCHQLTAPQDRNAVKAWVEAHDVEGHREQFMQSLASLQAGEAWVWSPARLNVFERVNVRRRWTYDSGATPTEMKANPPAEPVEVALDEIRSQLEETIAQAEANDPRTLKARIVELEQQLADAQTTPAIDETKLQAAEQRGRSEANRWWSANVAEVIEAARETYGRITREIRYIDDEIIVGLSKLAEIAQSEATDNGRDDHDQDKGGDVHRNISPQLRGGRVVCVPQGSERSRLPVQDNRQETDRETGRRPPARVGAATAAGEREGLSKPAQKILDALAWWASIGVHKPTMAQLGFRAGYKPRGGSFKTYISRLSTQGLIERGSGRVRFTEAGRTLAERPKRPATLTELHERIHAMLDGPQRKIFVAIIDAGGREMHRDEVAHRAGYEPGGGSFKTYLSRMSSAGLIERRRGMIAPADVLFPTELR